MTAATGDGAWRVTPDAYLERRPAEFDVAPPVSQHVAMRDGVRIALDVYLPVGAGPVPAIVMATPYYRRFALAADAPADLEPARGAALVREMFVRRGYALVVIDVRGTGASFGTRDAFRSPAERDDLREIADWIVARPWSNGAIGATGVSYVGAAADFLASTGHPAVRAVAPLFAVWDTWADHYYPGGLLLNRLAEQYDTLMVGLDHDRRDVLAGSAYFGNPHFRGPQPVDGDDGTLLRAAIAEHLGNFRMVDWIREFPFRDSALPYDPSFTPASFSPTGYANGIRPDVAVLAVSGWMDGAGYSNGAIARFNQWPGANRHLLLGPWDHGARANVSPFRASVAPEFAVLAEVLRFFDTYLAERETGLRAESPVHYFTIGAERWRESDSWPPLTQVCDMSVEGAATRLDPSFGTGTAASRYGRLAAMDVINYYDDWHGRDASLACTTGAALDRDTTLTGTALLKLDFVSDSPDVALHVYLEDVARDGTTRYVTEGMRRALHRTGTYARADAAPLVPGEATTMQIALLPTSWTFSAGHRVRVAISLGDRDNYGQVPHGRLSRVEIAPTSQLLLPFEIES